MGVENEKRCPPWWGGFLNFCGNPSRGAPYAIAASYRVFASCGYRPQASIWLRLVLRLPRRGSSPNGAALVRKKHYANKVLASLRSF